MSGIDKNGELQKIGILPKGCNAYNPAFDVTPAKYVTGLITEKGVCEANKASLKNLYINALNTDKEKEKIDK